MADKTGPLEAFSRYVCLERGLSPRTGEAYRSDLGQFLVWCGAGGLEPEKAGRSDIDDFLWSLKEKGIKPASLFRKAQALKAYFRFLAAEGRVGENPAEAVRAPRRPSRLPRALAPAQAERLLRAAAGEGWEGLRARAVLELLYGCGLRASELLSLRPESINFADGWLRVRGKGGKERLVPIHAAALAATRAYLAERERRFKAPAGELFLGRGGRPLSRPQLWRLIAALGRRAGLGGVHPHLLRHTFATHLLKGGADLRVVQELLGHADLATTQIYTHLDPRALKSAHGRHHPRG